MRNMTDTVHFTTLGKSAKLLYSLYNLAGVEGLEPPAPVLETGALPIELHSYHVDVTQR